MGSTYDESNPQEHPEVIEAMKNGTGYNIAWSEMYKKKFAYVAVRFEFQGQTYILRTAFPFTQLEVLNRNFQIGLFTIDLFFLILFSISAWYTFSRLSRPIHDIINIIRPYQEGTVDTIPEIEIKGAAQDEFNRLAGTLNSLSEKVRSQIRSVVEERNEKEAILESLVEGVIAVDGTGTIRYVNFIGSKMVGIPKRHLIGKLFPDGKDQPRADLLKKCLHLLNASQEQNTILTDSIALGDGQKVYLDLIAAPKPYQSGAIIVLQDKSSHYRVIEMGKDFVANASHELRTPITIIKGFAETLQDIPDISPDMLRDITEKIVRNCQRMDTLVKNLLTLADIDNVPENRFQECDIASLVENCRHMLVSVYPDAAVEILKEKEHVMAPVDPDLLELAIMNLLDNAAKYSKPPVKIVVRVGETADEAKISITDEGIGIPEEDIDHIFDRFYTVDKAHSRRLGGAGLGLSIVKTIIEKHEGTITVSSIIGKGTTFTIQLPRSRKSVIF
jgi:signal transduction histidine kinase